MGASYSTMNLDTYINSTEKNNIYISYNESNSYIENLENSLRSLKYNTINSSLLIPNIKKIEDVKELENYMKLVMEKTNYIFICVSKKTICSMSQTIEMNECITNNYEMIYLFVDPDYTPENSDIKHLVNNKKWFNLYNDDNFNNTINELTKLLLNK